MNSSGPTPFNHKYWEIELFKEDKEWNWFSFQISLTRKCDHADLNFYLEILGLVAGAKIYDSRHWNYKHDRYVLETDIDDDEDEPKD